MLYLESNLLFVDIKRALPIFSECSWSIIANSRHYTRVHFFLDVVILVEMYYFFIVVDFASCLFYIQWVLVRVGLFHNSLVVSCPFTNKKANPIYECCIMVENPAMHKREFVHWRVFYYDDCVHILWIKTLYFLDHPQVRKFIKWTRYVVQKTRIHCHSKAMISCAIGAGVCGCVCVCVFLPWTMSHRCHPF